MIKKLPLIAFILVISGCAAATKTNLPTGESGYNIDCSGPYLNWGKCYEKAGNVCGSSGYKVIAKDGDTGQSVSGNSFGVYGETTITRTLLVSCGSNG